MGRGSTLASLRESNRFATESRDYRPHRNQILHNQVGLQGVGLEDPEGPHEHLQAILLQRHCLQFPGGFRENAIYYKKSVFD